MNRKQRRAEKSGTRPGRRDTRPAVQGLFDEALRHHQAGRFAEAEPLYRRVLAFDASHTGSLHLLGLLAYQTGRHVIAIDLIGQAIAQRGDLAEFHSNLGAVLLDMDKLDEAEASYRRAIALRPNDADFLGNLASTLKKMGKLDEAIAVYKQALALQPDSCVIYNNLLMTVVYAASLSPADVADTAREFGNTVADPLRRQRPFVRDKDPERKLRIGYVSADFREHAVSYFVESLLKLHDRQQFEVFAYYNAPLEDGFTVRLKNEFDHWRVIHGLNDDAATDLIEADEIDILVDLAAHSAGGRLLVFARKPAPVQVTWLGYPATTGMTAMDYRITDSYAEPPGMTEYLNVETLWRLPEIFCCYQAHENSPDVIDHPPFEANGYLTFGCFNNFAKVTDPVLETWTQILAQVPSSCLLLEITGLESPKFRTEVKTRLQRLGLPIERVILEPRKKENQFVLYNRIDIALDPFPCAGGTTSFDTLWMGVPFVTLAGEHFVSRMGVTILTNAGMPELIAETRDGYISLAVNLALDKDRLRGLRHNLRQKVADSSLMNQPAFARNMEAAYRHMWRRWCVNES